jgi:SynChlorMet cassette radical SAM/SPASM protein ScmE
MIRFTKIPHSVQVTLTSRCNLNCDFCLANASKHPRETELSTNEWLKFFERLKELLIFNVILSGGEIFLRDDVFVLLNKLRENRMHRITLLTNGTLIEEEIASRLNQLSIKNISISLDGLERKHDEIRGKGSFLKTIDGIRCLVAEGITPQVAFTPIRTNYNDLGPLVDFIASLGITTLQINNLTPEGRCIKIYPDVVLKFPQQIKETLDVIEEKKNQHPGLSINCSMGFHYHLPQSYCYFLENPQNYEMKHLKDGCGAANTSFVVSSTGEMIPCCGLPDFGGGNIKEQDILDIWNNSENFKKLRELSNIPMDQTPYCKDCKYIFLCDGGCRAGAYLIYKDLQAPGITCPFFKGDKINEEARKKSCEGD